MFSEDDYTIYDYIYDYIHAGYAWSVDHLDSLSRDCQASSIYWDRNTVMHAPACIHDPLERIIRLFLCEWSLPMQAHTHMHTLSYLLYATALSTLSLGAGVACAAHTSLILSIKHQTMVWGSQGNSRPHRA